MSARPTLSFVIPLLDEEALVGHLHRELQTFLARIGLSAEVLFVDGGSRDRTATMLRDLATQEPRYRVVSLSRNFGKEAALLAGLDRARGHAVVVMDGDLQDPFDVVPDMINLWKQGTDVVYARARNLDDGGLFARLAQRAGNLMLSLVSSAEAPLDTGDYRLLSRRVVVVLRELRENHRFLRGLVAWVGFRQAEVLYNRMPRTSGVSKRDPGARLGGALSALTSVSTAPLRLGTYLGLTMTALSLLFAFVALLGKLFGEPPAGHTSLAIMVGLVSGVQLYMVSMIGEYVGRISLDVKKRAIYTVSEEGPPTGLDDATPAGELPAELTAFNALPNAMQRPQGGAFAPPPAVGPIDLGLQTAPIAPTLQSLPSVDSEVLPALPALHEAVRDESTAVAPVDQLAGHAAATRDKVMLPTLPFGTDNPTAVIAAVKGETTHPNPAPEKPATLVGVPALEVDARARPDLGAEPRPALESADIIELDAKAPPVPPTRRSERPPPVASTAPSPTVETTKPMPARAEPAKPSVTKQVTTKPMPLKSEPPRPNSTPPPALAKSTSEAEKK
jgi:glycosyltransferase involved in cell wall biosynthesis